MEKFKRPILRKFISFFIKLISSRKIFRNYYIKYYFKNNAVRKIQFGSSNKKIEGWLNTDISLMAKPDVFVDITKPLPFENSSVDFIFLEHLIEHIDINDAIKFIKECSRILKNNGVIRIVTPDLEKLISIYFSSSKEDRQIKKWMHSRFTNLQRVDDSNFLNMYFYFWGHKYIYDMKTLTFLLSDLGFVEIQEKSYGISQHPELCNLERHIDDIYFVDKEQLILEAMK